MSKRCGWPLLVLLAPLAAGAQEAWRPCPDGLEPALVLQALNALRAEPRRCAGADRPAAPALRWDARLARSAEAYAAELAQRDAISHVGRHARSLRERLGGEAYLMAAGAENLAAGPESLDETLQHWLASPAHCDNLMAPDLVDAGLACAAAPGRYQRFWVLHLGRSPRPRAP